MFHLPRLLIHQCLRQAAARNPDKTPIKKYNATDFLPLVIKILAIKQKEKDIRITAIFSQWMCCQCCK